MLVVRTTIERRVRTASIEEWSKAISAPEPGMEAIAEVIGAQVDASFASRTDPWGNAWAPLSPTTIEIRAQRGDRGGSLRRTKYARVLDGGRRAVVGLAASFARAFGSGAPLNKAFGRGSAPIPARPVLPLRGRRVEPPPEVRAEMRARFWEAMRRVLRG